MNKIISFSARGWELLGLEPIEVLDILIDYYAEEEGMFGGEEARFRQIREKMCGGSYD